MKSLFSGLRKSSGPRIRYRCPSCSLKHEGFPALAYALPDVLFDMPQGERKTRAIWSPDLCVLDDDRHFIRCVLNAHVEGFSSGFSYGPWIEVERPIFNRYAIELNGGAGQEWDGTLGRLANAFPAFTESTIDLACAIRRPSEANERPLVEIVDENHDLGREQRSGMTYARAIEIVSHMKGFLLIVD